MKKILLEIAYFFGIKRRPKQEKDFSFEESNYKYCSFDENLLIFLNEHRKKLGLNELNFFFDPKAIDIAFSHLQRMVIEKKVSHSYFDNRAEALRKIIGQNAPVSECVGFNFSSAFSYLNAFLDSPKHKKALEDSRAKNIIICSSYGAKYVEIITF